MKQLTQQLKSGQMEVLEVPFPVLGPGQILVRNRYSAISAGTEGKTVSDARKGYIAKAKSRQKEVKQVIEMVKTKGLRDTYNFVMNKLDAPSGLGYSSAGEVLAVGSGITNFKVGDRVACGGASACHADVVAVPENLAVKLPENVSYNDAALTTLGAIALQGIRQSELRLGENCLIIGMGLIGQLTYKLLEASGIRAMGVDVSEKQVTRCQSLGLTNVFHREATGLEEQIKAFADGYGCDAVIITAATSSLDPVELAGRAARKKGKVIIVGAVPTGFDRANYYQKELDLRLSMSYGPGRGDLSYEEKGHDYPIGYVRWTENRNMQAFVSLLEQGKLEVASLVTHTFNLDEAPEAYNLIMSGSADYNAILIRYDEEIPVAKVALKQAIPTAGKGRISLLGAGNFAQGTLLPALKEQASFRGVSSNKANMARYVGDKYGFAYCTADANELFNDPETDAVFICTRHDSHAALAIEALKAGKTVFVEKPLALTEEELLTVKNTYASVNTGLMVGFNRRFAPATVQLMQHFSATQPKAIQMRINAGQVAANHWVNDPEIGGGRIIGEACHFIDLAMHLAGAPITSVTAEQTGNGGTADQTVHILLRFTNESTATIAYCSNGNKQVAKEWIEVFCQGTVAQIDDFKSLKVIGNSEKVSKFPKQDKGHQAELTAFMHAIKTGSPLPISFEECYLSSKATLAVLQSIRENRKIVL